MRYAPGGYSWMGVGPESDYEKKIERIEDEIFKLKARYKKKPDKKINEKIHLAEEKLKEYRGQNKRH